MSARFNASYAGIGQMLRAKFMQEDMHRRAEKVAALAEATAPVGSAVEGDEHPGRYKASFHVESGIRVRKTTRAYGRVTNDAPEALAVEYGLGKTPKYRTLGSALQAAGD